VVGTISLLHATYRAGHPAVALRDSWFQAAVSPDDIEHIFALDADDKLSMDATDGYLRVINPPSPDRVSAVRNWNSAAAASGGALLVVIADDLEPVPQWDATLHAIVGTLDPQRFPFAIGLADDRGSLMRHPVISRCFYSRFGLFAPEFTGLYADYDITFRAFNNAVVLNGQRLSLLHRRPHNTEGFEWSESQTRLNAPEEYETGSRILRNKWGRIRRSARHEYFKPHPGSTVPSVHAAIWRTRLRLLGVASGIARRSRSIVRTRT
jgi:hypothetical protein